jgi:hypothetical protein
MTKMFNFDPASYAETFKVNGYVHIPQGLAGDFYAQLAKYIDDSFSKNRMERFAIGDKQQAMYEFLSPSHYDELRRAVATVCGLDEASLTLSERHIKSYEADADPHPHAHKDRFGSEISVGFSIQIPPGSTLILYDEHDVHPNPFNSTAELRTSFCQHTIPETGLKNAHRIEICDMPGDVIMFRGNAMWHLREYPAGTIVLYLKLNTYNCDTLGEDPHSADFRQKSLDLLKASAPTLLSSFPVIARNVDYLHRRYNRDWNEIFGAVMAGGRHLTISQTAFTALQSMNGQRTVTEVLDRLADIEDDGNGAEIIRCLVERGIVDLLEAPLDSGRIARGCIGQKAALAESCR